MFDLRDLYKPAGIIPVNVETTGDLAREVIRLRGVLTIISELGDVRCDEAPYIARTALTNGG